MLAKLKENARSLVDRGASFCRRNAMRCAGGAAAGVVTVASNVHAEDLTVDYSGVTTGVYTQLQTALTAGLPIMGALLGLMVGIKLYRRFCK